MTDFGWLDELGGAEDPNRVRSPFEEVRDNAPGSRSSIDTNQEPLAPRGVFDVFGEAGADRLPFAGTAIEVNDLGVVLAAAHRVQDGEGSEKDFRMLDAWVRDQQRGHTFLGAVTDLVLDIPKFAGEIFASGGTATVAKEGGKRAAKMLIEKTLKRKVAERAAKSTAGELAKRKGGELLTKAASSRLGKVAIGAADVAARVAVMEGGGQLAANLLDLETKGGIITHQAAAAALGRAEWEKDEFGRFTLAMDAAVPTTLEMLDVGFVGSMIEVGSELVGGRLVRAGGSQLGKMAKAAGVPYVPLSSKVKSLQMLAANRWLSKSGQRTVKKLLKTLERGGWHGVMGEFLEERVAGVGALGAEVVLGMDQDFDGLGAIFPSLNQVAVELAAFSVPSAGITTAVALDELRIRQKYGVDIGTRDAVRRARNRALSEQGSSESPVAGAAVDEVGRQGKPVTLDRPLAEQEPLEDVRTYKFAYGKLVPEEQAEQDRDDALLAGRAAVDLEQVDVSFGLYGTTADTSKRGTEADAISVDALVENFQEVASTAGAGYPVSFGTGRVNNLNQHVKRQLAADEYLDGANLRTMHGRIGKARDISEAALRLAQFLEVQLWRRNKTKQGEVLSPTAVYKPGGKAKTTDGMRRETAALGSIIRPQSKAKFAYQMEQIGFHEFLRMWLTQDGTEYMPQTQAWFEDVFAANNPAVYQKLKATREMVEHFRFQGSGKRRSTQLVDTKSATARWGQRLRKIGTPIGRQQIMQQLAEDLISEDIALRPISRFMDKFWRDTKGRMIPTASRPELVAEAARGQAQGMAAEFALRGPMTWLRRRIPGAAPLIEIAKLVAGAGEQFSTYLFLKRVVALHRDAPATIDQESGEVIPGGEDGRKMSFKHEPRLGGIGVADAVSELEVLDERYPDFAKAHKVIQDWWRAVLEFAAGGSKTVRAFVDRMVERDPGHWAPLHRVLEKVEGKKAGPRLNMAAALGVEVSQELEGSMEAVEDVFGELLREANRMFELAFRSKVLEVIRAAANIPGVGQFFNILEADKAPVLTTTIGDMAKELQRAVDVAAAEKQAADERAAGQRPDTTIEGAAGINIPSIIDEVQHEFAVAPHKMVDAAMEFFAGTPAPKGNNTKIIPFIDENGALKYMEVVDPALMRWLNQGGTSEQVNFLLGLARWHKKMFTLGTTGMRPVFTFFRNPVRDFGAWLLNTRTNAKLLTEMLPAWFKAMGLDLHLSTFREGKARLNSTAPELSDAQDLFLRLGLDMATEIATDSFYGQNLAKRLTAERGGKFTQLFDYGMGILQSMERTTRTVEVDLLLKEMRQGGKLQDSTQNLSEAEMWELIIAGKQVTSNFTVAGRRVRTWNQYVPFLNAAIQGPRETIRALLKMGPERRNEKMKRAFWVYTVPAIIAWLAVRDEDWYRELTVRDKAGSRFWPMDVVGNDSQVLVEPLPFEIGVAFAGIPIAMLDAYYREDPKGADWFLSDLIEGLHDSASMVETLIPPHLPPSVVLAKELYSNEKHFWKTPIVKQSMERMEKQDQYDEYSSNLAIWAGRTAKRFGFQEGLSPKRIDHVVKGVFGSVGADMAKIFGQGGSGIEGMNQVPLVGGLFKDKIAHPKTVNEVYRALETRQRLHDIHGDEDERERQVRLALRDATRAISALAVLAREVDGQLRYAYQEERLRIARHALAVHHAGKVDEAARGEFRNQRREYEPQKKAIQDQFKRSKDQ